MNVTALVLSDRLYTRKWPGLRVLTSVQKISTMAELNAARLNAISAVNTPCFFFLDDDDDLPQDYERVIGECAAADAPVAYTDRLVDGQRVASGPYSQTAHLRDPRLVHQLALYDTRAAHSVLRYLPRGHYYTELSLAWAVASMGAAYVPEIGYCWNKSAGAMHKKPEASIAQMRTILWCKENPL